MPRWTALVTLLALALYFAMSLRVGLARGRTGIKAPATTGHPDFERAFRIHQNTLEWMPLFLPSLWLSALTVDDRFAAVVGLAWIGGRLEYLRSYTIDPNRRAVGFFTQAAATLVLFVSATIGTIYRFFML